MKEKYYVSQVGVVTFVIREHETGQRAFGSDGYRVPAYGSQEIAQQKADEMNAEVIAARERIQALIEAYGEAESLHGSLSADGLTEDIEAAEKARDAAFAAVMEAVS